MAETLYCVTDIDHGFADGSKVRFAFGDEFVAKGFSAEELASLIQAGALSRVDPKPAQVEELTAEDAEALVAAEPAAPEQKPTK